MELAERRQHERFGVELPAEIVVQGASPIPEVCSATTRDISTSGAFLTTQVRYLVGVGLAIEVTIALKDIERFPTSGTAQVALKGTIIRAEAEGVAVKFKKRYAMRHIAFAKPT